MSVIVRAPQLTDAVGTGMACALVERERLGGRVDPALWDSHTEEAAVSYWHGLFATRVKDRRVAVAVSQRRIVGVCGVRPTGKVDRFGETPARSLDLFAFDVLADFAFQDVLERLCEFVLPQLTPCQCWVWREDQALRRFLRLEGFCLDGMSHIDPDTGVEYTRLVR